VRPMENLPFLSKNDQPSQSRNGPPSESDWPVQEPPQRIFQRDIESPKDPLEFLKNTNPIGLILLGIVIGVMIVSMRPIVVQSK
jgi:hypothetical protein